MRLPSRGEVLGVTAGLAVMGGAAGCGGGSHSSSTETSPSPMKITKKVKGPEAGSKPFHGILNCVAAKPIHKEWARTPSNLNTPLVAQELGHGVSPDQVAAGQMGTADCQQGIEASQVNNTKATVKGIGNLCVVIGLDTGAGHLPPEAGKTYHDVLAVCAAPEASAAAPAVSNSESTIQPTAVSN